MLLRSVFSLLRTWTWDSRFPSCSTFAWNNTHHFLNYQGVLSGEFTSWNKCIFFTSRYNQFWIIFLESDQLKRFYWLTLKRMLPGYQLSHLASVYCNPQTGQLQLSYLPFKYKRTLKNYTRSLFLICKSNFKTLMIL